MGVGIDGDILRGRVTFLFAVLIMGFNKFEEIEAWQGARLLAQKLKVPCKRAVDHHDWGWADQVGRSVVSIMVNIAEGNDALSNAAFISFLGYARRSGAEVRSHLYVGLDRGYLTQQEFEDCSSLALRVTRQIAKLIQYLEKHRETASDINLPLETC